MKISNSTAPVTSAEPGLGRPPVAHALNQSVKRIYAAVRGRVPDSARRSSDWLALGAAPTFAFMATFTALVGGGANDMVCSTAPHPSQLDGMPAMYALMSAFHLARWLKLISRWRNAAPVMGVTQPGSLNHG
jgi:hypothetical protein